MSEAMDYINREFNNILIQRDEARADIQVLVLWWWNNHKRDFFDFESGDDVWFEIAKRYNIELPVPVSAVETMHNRWKEAGNEYK